MAETLKEFMVSIGWDSNESQQRKFVDALEGATLRAKLLGDVIEEMARKVFDAVAGVADSFDKLYFASQRTGASAATIKDFSYAVSQLGGSAAAAQASLEAMGQKLRENPGNITYLNALGFGLNKVTGQLEYQRDLAEKAARMPLPQAELYRQLAGLDETTFLAMRHVEEMERRIAENAASRKASGLDPDKAAQDANRFMTIWRDLWNDLGNLADTGLTKLMNALTGPFQELDNFLKTHQAEIGDAIEKVTSAIGDMTKAWVDDFERLTKDPHALDPMFKGFHDFADDLVYIAQSLHNLVSDIKWLVEKNDQIASVMDVLSGRALLRDAWNLRFVQPGQTAPLPDDIKSIGDTTSNAPSRIAGWASRTWQSRPTWLGGAPAMGAGAATGKWWTPERMKHAAGRLEKEAGLSPMGAAGLVARWAGVEAAGGPGSVNPSSGAFGIAQWLGSRVNGIAGNTDFDAQLAHAIGELNGPESRAARQLRAAQTPGEAARGASMFERAEGYSPLTGDDAFTSKTPVSNVYGAINGGGAAGAFVIGDSIGAGVQGALHAPGVTTVGRSPGGVLSDIGGLTAGQLNGKTIILSGGASNDPSKAGLVAAQIKALIARGVDPRNIRVLGVGDRGDFGGVNDTLRSIAGAAGATFVPITAGADHVHPGNYPALAGAALAARGAPSIWGTFNPSGLSAANFSQGGDGGALGDYFRNHPAAAGAQMPDITHVNAPQTTTIHIDGANDPSIVAHMVAANQSRVASDMARNLQGATN